MIRFCCLSTSSDGNCSFIGSGNTKILVDCGISVRSINQELSKLSLGISDISAILVTHEHTDHVKALGSLLRKYRIPSYMSMGTIAALSGSGQLRNIDTGLIRPVMPDQSFSIGDLVIRAFSISHDAEEPVGYRISDEEEAVGIMTDTGSFNEYMEENLRDLDALLLESNYDEGMLMAGRYPMMLKRRILSDKGHLSNEMAAEFLTKIISKRLRSLVLGHLSRDNNLPEIAYLSALNALSSIPPERKYEDINIKTANRDSLTWILPPEV